MHLDSWSSVIRIEVFRKTRCIHHSGQLFNIDGEISVRDRSQKRILRQLYWLGYILEHILYCQGVQVECIRNYRGRQWKGCLGSGNAAEVGLGRTQKESRRN